MKISNRIVPMLEKGAPSLLTMSPNIYDILLDFIISCSTIISVGHNVSLPSMVRVAVHRACKAIVILTIEKNQR